MGLQLLEGAANFVPPAETEVSWTRCRERKRMRMQMPLGFLLPETPTMDEPSHRAALGLARGHLPGGDEGTPGEVTVWQFHVICNDSGLH